MQARSMPRDRFVVIREGADAPEVTVLMPVFEQSSMVAAAVASVLEQTDLVCEVIISDDASRDDTFARALDAVVNRATARTPHRVIVRWGRSRLRRDHVHLLADTAQCDIVMQAHGDDISHPRRARALLDALQGTGASMAASTFGDDPLPGSPDNADALSTFDASLLPLDAVVGGMPWLIGASQAWRRSDLAAFPPLRSQVVPASHDRILAVRAWLVGGVAGIDAPLVNRHRHGANWSSRLVDRRSSATITFGNALNRLCFADVVSDDLSALQAAGAIPADRASALSQALDATRARASAALRASYAELASEGRAPLWVDDDELRLAAQGHLSARLRRRARLSMPIQRAARMLNRGR
jgi:hypothetical protein